MRKKTVIKNSKKVRVKEKKKKQRCTGTLYPRQPHMHVCLFDASALFCRFTSPHTQTHTPANSSVRAPVFQASVHLWGGVGRGGWRGGKGESGGERETDGGWGRGGLGGVVGVRGSERERQSRPRHSSPSFTPSVSDPSLLFLELSKESLSPASQLRSSSVQLCRCVFVCVCAHVCVCMYVCVIYINIYL